MAILLNIPGADDAAAYARAGEALRTGRLIAFPTETVFGLAARGDPALLRAVLQNLLANAWKFTGKTAHPRVEFGAQRGENGVVFFVRDNGAGFDMAAAGKLFTPFSRLHHASDFPGAGIGLATVERIIRRHGGRIWAESAPNQGAAFYFTLQG